MLGTPEYASCPMVMQPENGRFVCSVGTVLKRNMCLVECKIGFDGASSPVVYICRNGGWYNLSGKNIPTPEPHCLPKTVPEREFPE